MAISVVLRCSECSTVRPAQLSSQQKDISCPVCGRRLQNLTEEEHDEIEAAQKSQRTCSIIAAALFAVAVVCMGLYMGDTKTWSSGTPAEPNAAFLAGTLICGLAAMVLGFLGSRKRFVVEF